MQIIGGIGSVALLDSRSVMNVTERTIVAPDDLFLSTMRDNGSRRDVDVLVTSDDQATVDEISDVLETTVGNALERSVFGFQPQTRLDRTFAQPFGPLVLGSFLADRYGNMQSPEGAHKALYPFKVPITPASMDPWFLEVGATRFLIPNPAMSVINYSQRSISGLRAKDEAKIVQLSKRVFNDSPELADWVIDGPGKEQAELTFLINSLKGRPAPAVLPHDRRFTTEEMMAHEAFAPKFEPTQAQRAILAIASFKAQGLGWFEHNDGVVAAWQRIGAFERLFSGVSVRSPKRTA